jgi:hypothetical protein
LLFQGQSYLKSATHKYTQSYARVAIDTGHPTGITKIDIIHPHKTSASMKQATITETSEAGWTGTGNLLGGTSQVSIPASTTKVFLGALQAVLSPSINKKDTKATEKTQILSRITQFEDEGVAWWGFQIDDEYDSEHGVELLNSNLPSMDFEYRGATHLNLPECIEVEVAAYWSTPRPLTWFGAVSPKDVPPYFNLCQVVIVKIPRNLTKSCDFVVREVADIGPGHSIRVGKSNPKIHSLEGKTFILQGQDPESAEQGMPYKLFDSRMRW